MEASGHFRSILARVCWRVRVMRSPGSETGTERGGRRVTIHAQFATFPDISSGVVSLFFPGLEVGALKRASHGVYLGNSNNTSNIQFVFVMKLLPSNRVQT